MSDEEYSTPRCGPCNSRMEEDVRFDIVRKENRRVCVCPKCKKWKWC